MLKTRTRKQNEQRERASERLDLIKTSILALSDDDLLDLADIFSGEPRTPLGELAFAEMAKRDISL
ncbi:MAG: hypothetical protein EOP66_05605 [Sphingomonas sp.]|nr:MAG: hypothetical protein EOP66_05605 [Sphingomonas sp.]